MLSFLKTVLPSRGTYCLSVKPVHGVWRDYAYPTIEQLASAAEQYARLQNDLYFALSSFNVGEKFSRSAANATYQRSFWLDIDCGEGKDYPTLKDGVLALKSFLSCGLPLPTVVCSGYGLHVYWPLTSDISTANWKALAVRLETLCAQRGFKVDPSRTKDPASVLRVPGSYNCKHGEFKPVKVLLQGKLCDPLAIAKTLIDLVPNVNVASQATSTVPMPANATAAANFSNDFTEAPPLKDPTQIVIKCRQIREMGSSPYPAWMLAVRTVLKTTGGRELVHKLSAQCASKYSEHATDRQIDALEKDPEYGAGTCVAFQQACPEKCADCPYRHPKLISPWSLGDFPKAEAIEAPALAADQITTTGGELSLDGATATTTLVPYSDDDYRVVPGKGVMKLDVDDDTGAVHFHMISAIEVYIHTLCIDKTGGGTPKRTYLMRKIAPGLAPVDIPFAVEEALGPQKIELWMAQCGMLPEPRYKKDMYNFMNTYISAIQNKLPEIVVRNHFGWDYDVDRATGHKDLGFTIGHEMITATGTKAVRLDDRSESIAPYVEAHGDIKTWLEVPALYSKLDQKFAQLLMCASFGAPLMRYGLGTATNVAYNFWDISGGKGKSSVLKAISSVWGDPNRMLMGRTDTMSARYQQYSVYRNLPILIDEITGMSDVDTSALLYDIVNGKEKAKSTSSGMGLAPTGRWETITVMTANQSLYEKLRGLHQQTSATSMRLIEMTCDFQDYSGTPTASVINNAMKAASANYGVAGRLFMQTLVRKPELLDKVQEVAEKFALKNQQSSDERFWLFGIGIPLYAGRIAKILGLIDYDIDALEDWCVNTLLPALRDKVKTPAPNGDNLLIDFLNENASVTLTVKDKSRQQYYKRSGTPVPPTIPSLDLDPYVVSIPRNAIQVRVEKTEIYDTIYISPRFLHEWCDKHGLSATAMLTDLVRRGFMPDGKDYKRYCLGRDVPVFTQNRTRLYCFRLRNEDSKDTED